MSQTDTSKAEANQDPEMGSEANPFVMDLSPPDLEPDEIPEHLRGAQEELFDVRDQPGTHHLEQDDAEDEETDEDGDLEEVEDEETDEEEDSEDEEIEDEDEDEDGEEDDEIDSRGLAAIKRHEKKSLAKIEREAAAAKEQLAEERQALEALKDELAPLARVQEEIEAAAINFRAHPIALAQNLGIKTAKDYKHISQAFWLAYCEAEGQSVPEEWKEQVRRGSAGAQQQTWQQELAHLRNKVQQLETGTDDYRQSRKLKRQFHQVMDDVDAPHLENLIDEDPDQADKRLMAAHAQLLREDGIEPDPDEVVERVEADIVKELQKYGVRTKTKGKKQKASSKKQSNTGRKMKTKTLSQRKTSSRTGKKRSKLKPHEQQDEELAVQQWDFGRNL